MNIAGFGLRYLWLAGACFGLLAGVVQGADELELEYQKVSRTILSSLREAGLQNTGVLKFSVRIGDGKFPTSVGALNMRLAEKLELALVLANPSRETKSNTQVGIVRAASDVADTIDGANHLSEEGRRLLFSKEYPLAWKHQGKTSVIPDSLIIGVVQVQSDLSNMNVELMLITRKDLKVAPLASLKVPTDLDDLMDSGESFTTRGLFDGGSVESKKEAAEKKEELKEAVKKKALLVRTETLGKSDSQSSKLHPLTESSDSPISFEVWYDNQRQAFEFRDGAAFVKEPAEGQKVILAVRRKGNDKKRYGVLIRVNGENTLYRERTPDAKASIWILEPDAKEFGIRGFQIDNDTRQEFKVLSDAESVKRTVDYGRDVGMISVVLFQEDTQPPTVLSDDELDLAVQTQATLPTEAAESRGQLGQSLFEQLMAQDTTRGLIAEGESTKAAVDTVTFKRDLTPVMATSIRYYNAK